MPKVHLSLWQRGGVGRKRTLDAIFSLLRGRYNPGIDEMLGIQSGILNSRKGVRQMHRAVVGRRQNLIALRIEQRVPNSAPMRVQCRDKAAVRRPRQMHRVVVGRRQNLIALRTEQRVPDNAHMWLQCRNKAAVRRP